MRISDWSSDVCSSDLQLDRNNLDRGVFLGRYEFPGHHVLRATAMALDVVERSVLGGGQQEQPPSGGTRRAGLPAPDQAAVAVAPPRRGRRAAIAAETSRCPGKIGRAACRGRGCKCVEISGGPGSLK